MTVHVGWIVVAMMWLLVMGLIVSDDGARWKIFLGWIAGMVVMWGLFAAGGRL